MKKNSIILKLTLFIVFLCNSSIYSQDCKPTSISKDGKQEYFGGKIRDGIGLFTDDKSAYSFYVVQVDKGKSGTVAYVSFYESLKNREDYNNALKDYLNNDKLNSSYLEIFVDNMVLTIPTTSCVLEPKSTLGEIYGYSVNFEGTILKSQVKLLQKSNIKKFKIVLGGKPYEKAFENPTKITQTIMAAMNCVNLENIFEIQKKKSEELDLSEVLTENYSNSIIGTWLMQGSNNITIEFSKDKIIVSQMGKEISQGTYKVSSSRLIYTSTTTNGESNNGVSEFKMFLKDMIILKNNDKEYTYERIK
jgi:hypothetical protein